MFSLHRTQKIATGVLSRVF